MTETNWDHIDRVDPTPYFTTPEERSALLQLAKFIPSIDRVDAGSQGIRVEKSADGALVLWSEIDPAVGEFFSESARLLGQVKDYLNFPVNEWLAQPHFLERVELPQLRIVLTWMARGERFCDGFWAVELANGNIKSVLLRMKVISERSEGRT